MRLLDGLDDAQRHAVTSPAAPLCIVAGAGSGKTRVLTRRIAYRIATGEADAARTVAVTFTRRAAWELRTRLRSLGLDVDGGQRVHVGTLHSLVYGRLRQYWRDNGIAPRRIFDNATRGLTVDEQRRRGIIEFDEVLLEFAEAVRHDRAFADAVRWFFRHVYVDEFQDVSAAQFEAVMALVGDRADLCVVGDPNQSIYGWNGADPSLMASLPARFPGLEVVRLDANYRSAPPIVAAAARVLHMAVPAAGGERGAAAPTLTRHTTPDDEADAIARAVRAAHAPNTPWSDIAVLARSNAYLEGIAAALHRSRIPYRIAGRLALLGRPAVREGLAGLPHSVPAVEAALQLRSAAHDYDDAIERGALHEVADLARDFDGLVPGGSVAAFIEWLPTVRPGDTLAGPDAVQLVTFHKAKGLEWRTVFVAGVHDGLVPVANGDVEEERRLLYVAMTRAERALHLSYAGHPSPFLPDGFDELAVPPAPSNSPERVADLRSVLAATSPPASARARRRRHPAA